MTIFATGVSGTLGKHLGKEVEPINCDLANPREIEKIGAFSANDCLVHLAGVVGTANVEYNLEVSRRINVLGSVKLANEFLENGGKKFIYISSSHVYANSDTKLLEESELGPKSKYAEQKVETESRLRDLFLGSDSNLCIIRIFSVLDWDVQPFTLGGAIRRLTDTSSDSELKYGDDVRDFLTPSKIAETIQSLANISTLPEVLNLCSGVGLSVAEVASSMLSENGLPVPRERIHSGLSENPYIVGNNDRIKAILPDLDLRWLPRKFEKLN